MVMVTKMEIELYNSSNQTIIDIVNSKFTLTTTLLGENDYGIGKDNSTTTGTTGGTTTGESSV